MTRIIGGEWRGHSLPKLKGGSVRPTTDRARTVLFDTLHDVNGMKVLDLYSGTGALGFEALSRGARSLVSIDLDSNYIQQQKTWIKTHEKPFKAYIGDVNKVLDRISATFDLILADPPYAEGIPPEVLTHIEKHVAVGAIFVYERNRRSESPLGSKIFDLVKEKVVAETRIQIYKAVEL
ncbi:MAG: RsmD family RNA methyltransferase [Candidatus Marinimicrobia bacterium]|nr:RsmD family RNA methyltransferase [Candidatus Neomarinimicrobiota bacterium]